MNHIYKSVWNEHTGAYVAVSEKTKTKGKRSGSILFKTVAAGILGFCLTGGVANAQVNSGLNNLSNLSTTAALSPVMGILGGLTGSQGSTATNLLGGVLDPVLGLVGGLTGGQSGTGTGGLLDPVLGLVGGLTGGNGGLLGGGSAGAGAITDVQGTVDRLVDNTALAPVGGLVNGLVDPQAGALAPVTGLVNDLTSASGPLAPVGGLVNGLVGDQGALTPVVSTVNGLLSGVTGGLTGGAQGGPLDPVLGLVGGLTGGQSGTGTGGLLDPVLGLVGGLTGGNGGLLGGGSAGAGAITDVQGTVDRLVDNTALAPVGGLVNGLVDPQTGALAPVTGLVNDLTSASGPLAPVGGLVNGLVGDQGALTPVVSTVNGLLIGVTGGLTGGAQGGPLDPVLGLVGGLTGGQSGTGTGGLLDPVLGLVGGLTGGNGGLLGGGSAGAGAITDVQGTVDRLVDNTALAPVGGLVNGLVDPQTGALAPVTGLVNDLTSASGPLAPVGGLVNGLVGDQGALTPVVGTVNNLLSGLTGGLTGGGQGGGLLGGLLGGSTGNPGTGGAASGGLLGGLLGGGQSGGQSGGLLGGLLGGGTQGGSGNVLDLATGITLPQNQLGNTLDGVLTPLLTPVEGLLNSLLGALAPVVDPVVGVVNGITAPLGIELPTGLHLDLVDDLSLALRGEQPLDLALLQSDGNIAGLVKPTAGTNPGTPGSTTDNAVLYDDDSKEIVTLGGAGATKPTTITNLAAGVNDTDAVNMAQLKDVGTKVTTVDNRVTTVDNRVTALTIDIENGTIGLVQQAHKGQSDPITVGKDTDGTEVNFTGTEGNRRLTGVAAGTVTTDAVNVGQLQSALTALGGGAKIEVNGTVTGPTYDGFSDTSKSFTDVGSALYYLDDRVTNIDSRVTNIENNGVGGNNLVHQENHNAAITVGKSTGGNEVNFRNENGEARRLTGVADAVNDSDAVNYGQVKDIASSLRGDIRRVEKRADAGAATAMAVAGLPQAYLPGKSMISMAGGVYASESGYAIGASTVTENGKWVLKGSVAGSSRGQMGATIGAGYQW